MANIRALTDMVDKLRSEDATDDELKIIEEFLISTRAMLEMKVNIAALSPELVGVIIEHGDLADVEKIIQNGGTPTADWIDMAYGYGKHGICFMLAKRDCPRPPKMIQYAIAQGDRPTVTLAMDRGWPVPHDHPILVDDSQWINRQLDVLYTMEIFGSMPFRTVLFRYLYLFR
jgi:hypothetical protein